METSAKDRIDMLNASIAGDSRFAVDNCEIRREGVSYTINTLEEIIERYLPEGKPALIIGDDLAADFPTWRQSDKILKLADIAIGRRINSEEVKCSFPHITFKNEVMSISSHEIRRKISEEGDWRTLVPFGAAAIIEDRQLYGFSGSARNEAASGGVILRVETAAREALSVERFLHSRNTALHAFDLCRRFGLDPMDGYLAGVAHDLVKQLDSKQMLKIVKSSNYEISDLEKEKPNLLHGKAAAVLLRECFSVHNEDILEAVAFHTSGSENMGRLAKIIYIADKTESSRNIDTSLRKMCREEALDTILLAVLEKTISKLRTKGVDLTKDTLMLLNRIKEKKN
jgi:nicotinate-nucleotide adenylyltransferase